MPFFTTTYGKLAAALMRLHSVPVDQVPAFHSKFGSLQRGGLLGDRPGKGQKLEYGPDHFHRAILAFELTEAGVAPGVILRLIKERWDKLHAVIMKAERAIVHQQADVVLVLGLSLIDDTIPSINHTTRDKVGELAMLALDSRLLLVNLSAQLRRFHENLAVLHLQPDELFELAERAGPKKDALKIKAIKLNKRKSAKRAAK
jgi:hypothetical protein